MLLTMENQKQLAAVLMDMESRYTWTTAVMITEAINFAYESPGFREKVGDVGIAALQDVRDFLEG